MRQAFSHVLSQTGVQKAYQKSILLKKDCSYATLLHSIGQRKNVASTFVKNIQPHQQCHIKEQHRNNGKTLNDRFWAE
jgi:hypothetical protein